MACVHLRGYAATVDTTFACDYPCARELGVARHP